MSLTVVLSGPKAAEPQVRTALASAGFEVQKTVDNHGLPDMATEKDRDKKPKQPVAFVTVTVEEDEVPGVTLAAVVARAQTIGYVLRMHHETSPEAKPSPEMQLASTIADMRREIDELKGKLAA